MPPQATSRLLLELDTARKNAKISVVELAQRAELPVEVVRHALNPSNDPLVSIVQRIAAVLGMTLKLVRRKQSE